MGFCLRLRLTSHVFRLTPRQPALFMNDSGRRSDPGGTAAPGAHPARAPTLALVGGRIIDGYEGRPIDDGVVLIAGERIVALGRRGEVSVPSGTPTIDTRGMSILPGLADMHVHLMIVGHGNYEHWDAIYRSRFRKEIMPAAARQVLARGVTF